MQVYVCIKHVPDSAAGITVVDGKGYKDAAIKFVVNPYDEYALEEAVKIAKAGKGEVIAVTVGAAKAMTSLRSALAVGADRGILVTVDGQFLDASVTAAALHKAIADDGQPAIILAGKQSIDSEGMQTHYRLAEKFGMPVATDVVKLTLNGDQVVAEREIGGGTRQVLEMALPCVIGATKGLNEPRYPKLPDILKAKKKPVKQVTLADLGVDAAATTELLALDPVPERAGAKMLDGDVRQQVVELVRILKEEEKVL